MKVSTVEHAAHQGRYTLDDLVPYGPGLGSVSLIMKGLFELASKMGTTNITPSEVLIYLLDNMPEDKRKVLKDALKVDSSEDIKKRFGLLPSKMWGCQAVSEDQITISKAVQLVFRRAKQISNELGDRYIGLHHLTIALFKECELNHHTSPEISSLMAQNGVTSQNIKDKLL